MDETDLVLVKKLMENSRLTFRELAEISNLSVGAIHKRIKGLIEDETINAFTARPSVFALKSLHVAIFGISKAKSMDTLSKELGQHENTYFTAIASGKFIYAVAYLRDISELQNYSIFVSKTGQIDEPTVGIINYPYITLPESLTSIDHKILKTLNRDSRKSYTDIGDDVGLSAKTVRKRLDRMIENKIATFSIEWTPKAANNFMTVFHLFLKEETNIFSTIQHLYEKYSKNVAYCLSYSNIPNFITMHTWAATSRDSQRIQEELQEEGFKDVIPHIILYGEYFDCWVDQLLRIK